MSKKPKAPAHGWGRLESLTPKLREHNLLDRKGKVDSIDSLRQLVRGNRLTESFMMATNGGAMFEPQLRPVMAALPAQSARGAEDDEMRQKGSPPRERIAHNVLGNDERVLIRDTTLIPARSIGLLSIDMANGTRRWGTAWLLGPRTLATAAHNLLHPDYGCAIDWTVYMAYDGFIPHGGVHKIVDHQLPKAWIERPFIGSPYDFAILKIADATVGNTQGWFGFVDYEDSKFDKLALHLLGYPMNVDKSQQYSMFAAQGRALRAEAGLIYYDCDAGKGMSGGPVFARFGEQRVVVGIHVAGGDGRTGNVATRINDVAYDMFKELEAW